jgi:hypothetical protein
MTANRGQNGGKPGDFGVFFGVSVFASPLFLKVVTVSPLFAVWRFCILWLSKRSE